MKRSALILSFLATASTSSAALLSAQDELEYDPVQRIYTLTYLGDDGIARQVEIIPPNHVEPLVTVGIAPTTTARFQYQYTLTNQLAPLSEQAIVLWKFACPPPDAVVSISAPNQWSGVNRYSQPVMSYHCVFNAFGEGPLEPGQTANGFQVISEMLPRIVRSEVFGLSPGPPTLEGIEGEKDPELAALIMRATGQDGGSYELLIVAPGIDPVTLTDPELAFDAISSQLEEVCDLEWIDDQLCTVLIGVLENAANAWTAGNTIAADAQLAAFLGQLSAARGLQVDENAYELLSTNVQFLAAHL